jgi:thiol-disulfide isomerase/thioredoxin
MIEPTLLETKFAAALPYDRYVATGKPDQQTAWNDIYERASLTNAQRKLIAGFERDLRVLVVSGTWCGDCVQQCPLIARIAEAGERIDLRFVDRDEHMDLAQRLTINEGVRVPVAVFISEEWDFVSAFGDRSLTRYRALAAKKLGASCPLPGAPIPDDELAGTLQDWLDEVERVQLLLRLSPKLRQKHAD